MSEPIAIDPETIARWAAMVDLVIPEDCLAGVAANLAILHDHAARIDAAEGDRD